MGDVCQIIDAERPGASVPRVPENSGLYGSLMRRVIPKCDAR